MSLASAIASVVALALAAGLAYQRLGTARDTRHMPPPGRLVPVGRGRLHVHCMGSGTPPVVFESGIAASSLNWTEVQREVAAVTAACAYDRSGLGWSEAGHEAPTAAHACTQLRALLNAAGIPPPYVLVGHSFGAYVLLLFAARHPEDVAGMVLLDPLTVEDWSRPTAARLRTLRGGALFARIGAGLAAVGVVRFCLDRFAAGSAAWGRHVLAMFGVAASEVVLRIVGEVGKMPPDAWPAIRAHWSRPRSFLAMSRHLLALPASAIEVEAALRDAPPWAFPLAVLTSETSGVGPDPQRKLAARSTGGLHVIVPGAGHWVHLDAKMVVVETIRRVVEMARASPLAPVPDPPPRPFGLMVRPDDRPQ